jgi:hypothetical protein
MCAYGFLGRHHFALADKPGWDDNFHWRADLPVKEVTMPKMSDRERLAELEARQRRVGDEIIEARRALRGKYAALVLDLSVESLTEREFRDLLGHAIRLGGAASIAALART